MRTIVQFIDNLRAGGKERQCVELVRSLAARGGFRNVVVSMDREVFFQELHGLPNTEIRFVVRRSRHDPLVIWDVLRLWRVLRPELVTAWHVMPALYALPACRLLGVPLVSTFIQDAPEPVPRRLARHARLAFAGSTLVVANSRAGIAAYGPPPERTRLIYSGFDLGRRAWGDDPGWLRRQFGIDHPLVVGMVATFSSFKDQPTLIRAAQRVLAQRRDVCFVLVGGGPTLEACRALVPPALARHILLPGRVGGPIERVVCGLDIGALASFTECISNSVAEYMMFGLPVVATDSAGIRELVTEGESGFLVPAGDDAAFAERLLRLIADPALRKQAGQAGRAFVERELPMPRIVDAFVAAYDSVAQRR